LIDVNGKPLAKIFHQLKYHGSQKDVDSLWEDGQCYLQAYNVFWDTTGHEENGKSYCYACDSITVLSETTQDNLIVSSERKFNPEKWGTVTNTDVEKLYKEPVRPYFDPRKICSACLFMPNNKIVKKLLKTNG
jgi:hypothetical protein